MTRRDTGNSLHDHSYDLQFTTCESLGFAEGVITKLLKSRALNNRKRSDKAENTKFGISRENNIKNVHFAAQINWWGRYMCTSMLR